MNSYAKGLISGFVATVGLSVLMILKAKMGMLPQMNVIKMLAGMAHAHMGIAASPVVGWIMHFAIGTVLWGLLFAFLYPKLPGGGAVAKGVAFSIGAWVLMMILPMPMAGAGFFGLKMGIMAPIMTLILHIIWGLILGGVYAALPQQQGAGHARAG